MKHHPIIFAMGEDVPAISLNLFRYYEHKNIGALAQYGMDRFSVNLDSLDFLNIFTSLFNTIEKEHAAICVKITEAKRDLIRNKDNFLEMTDNILKINN